MRLSAFDEWGTRSDQADWLELSLVISDRDEVSSAAMRRIVGLLEESPEFGDEYDSEAGEELDGEILESGVDQFIDDIWQELEFRTRTLGAAYPFELLPVGEGFLLKRRDATDEQQKSAHRSYVACLLISAARRKAILQEMTNDPLSDLTRTSARIMQILAVKSAAHFLAGDSYWFGWPRRDRRGKYPDALKRLVGLLGHGRLKREAPEWSTSAEKDGTVDVVAWRSFPDRRYGSLIVYGQVASGKNWASKPITAYINGYFHDWFEDDPAQWWLPAMFIPFNLHGEIPSRPGSNLVDVALGVARREERTFGIVFDRMRITAVNLIDEEADCRSTDEHMQDHAKLTQEIDSWISSMREYASSDG